MTAVLFAKQQKLARTCPMEGRHIVFKSKQPSQDLSQDIRLKIKHLYVAQIGIYYSSEFCFNYSLLHFPELLVFTLFIPSLSQIASLTLSASKLSEIYELILTNSLININILLRVKKEFSRILSFPILTFPAVYSNKMSSSHFIPKPTNSQSEHLSEIWEMLNLTASLHASGH